jgi:hypothetical protein
VSSNAWFTCEAGSGIVYFVSSLCLFGALGSFVVMGLFLLD